MAASSDPSPVRCPFVYWAQSASQITLKVELKDSTKPKWNLGEKEVEFEALGTGAHGESRYTFKLSLYKAIVPQECKVKVSERQVDIVLQKKKEKDWWDRLLAFGQGKPQWLKVDFDKWKSEDDEEEENRKRDIFEDYPSIYDDLKNKELGPPFVQNWQKLYLFMYNLWQWIAFMYILIVLGLRYLRDGPDSFEYAWMGVGKTAKFATLMQVLEVIHPLWGIAKGKPLNAFIQLGGRSVILFLQLDAEPRLQIKPVVFYILVTYALIEVVRYPYYMFHVYGINFPLLTWLRYTMWIPLYPLGFICEGVIFLRGIPYFEETGKYTVSLPNSWNWSFHFPNVVRIYLLLFFIPVMYAMMMHMYRQRKRILGPHTKSHSS
ncbi:unnamed protein product [Darwinula stevensoni]|uniref:Very-long-chain (3R)-3-hydroxyacyl-CoA dehydratase n=1 Tax=Darwinula stevensoni TaxID=69355 RepID=A0A7R8XEQ1_9CRUS|nr:unnamed protein product [Darwinula stevensoni]CAG0894220.1 unnamed protein product [Darwinula stevensoni]